jgi:amidase
MTASDICFRTATDLAAMIRQKELSVSEVMQAHLEQIEKVNPKVNAIVTYKPEDAIKKAKEADEALAKGNPAGPLFGLPIAHKDMVLTRGVRTTFGSPILADNIPDKDDLIVKRLKAAGAISVGKTNTPEFGAGSQTFNEVFGATLNPYDITKTCGGSSGGAAVALACGMVPIADGSDLGGSLRNPANFCNVVGFRPSPGRVPSMPVAGWFSMAVEGPMARTVRDAALLLSAIAGFDPMSPVSLAESGEQFLDPLDRDFKGCRIAWAKDPGGLPVDPEVTRVIEGARHHFQEVGCVIEENEPDFTDADPVFKVFRSWYFSLILGEALKIYRDKIKDTVIWEIERGLKLSGADIGKAEVKRTTLFRNAVKFMESYDFIVMPVSQVPPFDAGLPYITEINGEKMETYIDWMKSCYYITTLGFPAISVPCGFTTDGLPVGIQIVGRHLDDFGVLQLAHAFEQATGIYKHKPMIAR